ncbi:hypothetical protein L195_g011231 [Trifolium pratense]|uniref:Lysine ketoglutarate reductase trans-splicing-like protein n=2 Tax=Trifolium pratense TaxID=57577 RepID=A0A2K3PGX8_TRIPR|nr:hypothetical protein L195_g011231 [Trifolium pratense]
METNDKCKKQCRPSGSEALPEGIISSTSSFEMRALWELARSKKVHNDVVDSARKYRLSRYLYFIFGLKPTIPTEKGPDNLKFGWEVKVNASSNLFAMAVGIKQKDLVNKMVKKFLESNFIVMLFHYDGMVDGWKIFEWSHRVIHISVPDQTKWWFAKRFLHPDIVAEYDYIFLWDEDLGVENFHPDKYISIVKEEGLEISQPALDPKLSEVHHQITARGRRSIVHRRTYKPANGGKGCDESSTAPPCTGWIEVMAPVFSKAAWRCVWYMIQGDRTKNVGVVDAEYIVHYNRPTLGGIDKKTAEENVSVSSQEKEDHRVDVRRLSYHELDIFKKRWEKAVEEDKCWVDPFEQH